LGLSKLHKKQKSLVQEGKSHPQYIEVHKKKQGREDPALSVLRFTPINSF
jgi:hypothetical protein